MGWGKWWEGGCCSHWKPLLISLFLSLSPCFTSRGWPPDYSSRSEWCSFSRLSVHCKVTLVPSPVVSHSNLKYLPHTWSVFYLPPWVCVWGDIVFQEGEKDPLPVSNCLSHSSLSLNLPGSTYFLLILAPSLFLLLSMGGFVSYLRHKTPIHSMS